MNEGQFSPVKFTTELAQNDMLYLLKLLQEQNSIWKQAIRLDAQIDEDRANMYRYHMASIARIHAAIEKAYRSEFPR